MPPDTYREGLTMPRYIITEIRGIRVKEFYEVEAASPEEARDLYDDGECEFLGHDLCDAISGCESDSTSVEPAEDVLPAIPFPAR